MKKGIFLLAASMIFASGMFSAFSQQTKLLTAEKHNEYGLVYTLPVTALNVRVTAIQEIRQAGPFYQYAKKYAGSDKAVSEDSEVWTIESIEIIPYGIPDPDESYIMQLKAGSLTYIGVAEDGMLLSINTEPDAPGSVAPPSVVEIGRVYDGKEYLSYVGEDFIAAQSSAKQAQMLSEELMEIRDAKISLTRGTADAMPTDGRQLELMLNSLEEQEGAIMRAFLGNIAKRRVVRDFTFVPSENGRKVLFRMSDFAGFTDSSDYSGDPVNITVNITNEGQLPVDAKGEEKKMPKDAVAYCIPGAAEITVDYQGKTLYSKELDMAQFGIVFGLNPSMFTDKKEPSYAIFDPATGAVKEIGVVK